MAIYHFDVARLVDDFGGPAKMAVTLGVSRTTPYRWMRQGNLSSTTLCAVLEARPNTNINAYFVKDNNQNDGKQTRSRT